MLDYIEGDLVSRSPTQAVIATGGVGYAFTIPVSSFDALPQSGRARLLVYLYVREDALRLYGFTTEDERRLFIYLLSVQGIGPGTALAVLNGMSVNDFRVAVAHEDLVSISRIKGIGRKTAQRVVLELKREMEREMLERPAGGPTVAGATGDAVAAMLALGYKRSASEKAVARAQKKLGPDAPTEQLIRNALQQI